ncbi:metallophosphoesterase family protein [Pseudorhodoplanes sp.]|uniref:metallophosphoesterase family protein n=1 Tax=Pseudorhodoplanes sp. TaxID=1934341 RepID=UPI003919AA5F
MFLLAHMSDPHLGPMPSARIRELAGKRAIGYMNWHRRRKTFHRGEVLSRIVADIKSHRPDHIAVTGDILNIALPGEFAPSRVWLDTVGPAHDVTFVPGNHDAYVRKAAREWHSHWGDFMKGDTTGADHFPFVRRRGEVALIGLSSAITTAPFMATGKLGPQQLHALAELLDRLSSEGLFRVVLIHHPPVTKAAYRFKRLIDADKFRQVLRRHGAELVLHGHDHIHSLVMLDGPSGKIPAVGVPSASAIGGEGDRAGYNLYSIGRSGNHWRCEMTRRGLAPGTETIVDLGQRALMAA